MTSDTIVKAISLILAPVVMITACAIIQNGLIAHYTAISNHLRSVNQELLSLSELDLSTSDSKAIHRHDLEHLLLPDLLRRSHLVHHVLGGSLCCYSCADRRYVRHCDRDRNRY